MSHRVLIGFVIAIGFAACSPAAENKSAPETTDAAETPSSIPSSAVAPDSDKLADRFTDERGSASVLAMGPRPDRAPPLQDCGDLANQTAMNNCAQKNYKSVQDEMDFIYQAWLGTLPEDGRTALDSAELAWISFRDRTCTFERDQFAGGSIAPFVYNTCLAEQTIARTDELYEPKLAQNAYEYADGILNANYQALKGTLSEPRRSELTDAQLAWIDYRDRHCAFETSYAQVDIEESQCKARLSEERTRQIQADIEQNSL